ncbi:putative RNA methylase [Tupanvirus deep ocean]|uniref:RNA methylase n=2 Tax=Tupanvirus TaxID=2094720 RepID=A0AC62A852_9VIRU|nr:putative RNA methylase [Tupanvirus deep ocean]QKU33828.1 putative RNA methylase [Tupanvirus deep ocean]
MEYSQKAIYVPKSKRDLTNDNNLIGTDVYQSKHNNYYNNTMEPLQITKRNHNYRNVLSLKRLIFPPISNDKLSQLMIDDDSIKYITFTSSAQEITNIIMNNLSDFPCHDSQNTEKWRSKPLEKKMKKLVITEMTAGVGGNVLNFAKYFKYVNAIEIDTIRYNFLNKNIKLYGYQNVNCYNADSLNLLIDKDDIVQDIIFFDPPWGGKNYKLHTSLRLNFGEHTIEKVCKILFGRPRNKMIVMKLPKNYDFDYLMDELKEYHVSKIILDRMVIVVIKNYQCDN